MNKIKKDNRMSKFNSTESSKMNLTFSKDGVNDLKTTQYKKNIDGGL